MINKFPQNKPKVLIGNNQLVITVNPFDNFYRFTLSRLENDAVIRYNLNDYTEIKMTIKGPKKDLNFNVFRESNENDFENGVLVFRISESMNAELGRLAKKNFNLFYINGVDVFGNRQIIYSGFYKMWDSKKNIEKLEQDYSQENSAASNVVTQDQANSGEQEEVNDSINNGANINTTTNSSDTPISEQILNSTIDLSSFKPIYRASDFAISIGLAPAVNDKLDYKNLSTKERAELETNFKNRNYWTTTSSSDTTFTYADLSKLFPGINTSQAFDKNLFIDYVEAYFKGLDIFPNTTVVDNWFSTSVLKNDLTKYIKNKKFRTSEVIAGLFLPLTPEQKSYFNINNIPSFRNNQIPNETSVRDNSTSLPSQSVNNAQSAQSISNSGQNVSTIRGFVTSGGGVPIGNARVTISSITGKFTNIVVYTTNDGKFDAGAITRLTVNNAGVIEILIRVTKEGFDDGGGRSYTLNNIKQIYSQGTSPLGIILLVSQNNQSSSSGSSEGAFSGQNLVGIVRDNDTNNTISSVQVKITSPANIFSERTVQTNNSGVFDFGPVSNFNGDVKFRALKTGYQTKEFDLSTEELQNEIKTDGVKIKIINNS
jgi:hypothetical protein